MRKARIESAKALKDGIPRAHGLWKVIESRCQGCIGGRLWRSCKLDMLLSLRLRLRTPETRVARRRSEKSRAINVAYRSGTFQFLHVGDEGKTC